jgi:hypothetical protein
MGISAGRYKRRGYLVLEFAAAATIAGGAECACKPRRRFGLPDRQSQHVRRSGSYPEDGHDLSLRLNHVVASEAAADYLFLSDVNIEKTTISKCCWRKWSCQIPIEAGRSGARSARLF